MFTSIRLKNFKSFGDIYFDFSKKKNEAKKFIAIYGENGSGKTNFANAFELLMKSFHSFKEGKFYSDFSELLKKGPQDLFREISGMQFISDFSRFMSSCKMIDNEQDTHVEYGFLINGIEGKYTIVFNTKSVVFEELYYRIRKRRGILYTVSKTNDKIDIAMTDSLFTDTAYSEEFKIELEKYWGKHTFLGILENQINTLNMEFIEKAVSGSLLEVLNDLKKAYIISRATPFIQTGYSFIKNEATLFDVDKGFINIKDEDKLDLCERILNEYMTSIYTDVKRVYYQRQIKNDRIEYVLYFEKMIAGSVKNIPFGLESTGTQRIPEIVRAVMAAMNGATVIFDEIDTGVHDMLMENIISSSIENITGQMIITTHNTMLLETLDPSSVYIIYLDYKGNKQARCLNDYDIRIRQNNNVRDMYLKGLFGGIPYPGPIDYTCMLEISKKEDI